MATWFIAFGRSAAFRQSLAALLTTTALGAPAFAIDGTWTGTNGADWTTAANWSSNPFVPDGIATFTNQGPTTVQNNAVVSIGAIRFTDAQYTVNVTNTFNINGSGIAVTTANPAVFNVSDRLLFQNQSSAGTATLRTAAGPGSPGSGGLILFSANSTAASAAISVQSGGAVGFLNNSTGGSASYSVSTGGAFDISQLTTAGTTVGSITGGGTFYLGSRQLTVGSNNAASDVSGVIADGSCGCIGPSNGSGGSLVKAGTGQLNLSGTNTYTGPTLVSAGTLSIAAGGSITSDVTNRARFTNAGTVTGAFTNTGDASVIGGTIRGAIANNAGGQFSMVAFTGNSTFNNASGATLIASLANSTLAGRLTNGGSVTIQSSGLDASTGGIINLAGGSITVNFQFRNVFPPSQLRGDLSNAGVVGNGGSYVGNVVTNTGAGSIFNEAPGPGRASWSGKVLSNAATITNSAGGSWFGDVVSNVGTITNGSNGFWLGNFVSNAGTLTNAASATWMGNIATAGNFTNAGTVTGTLSNTGTVNANGGAIEGAVTNAAGTFNVNGAVSGGSTFANAPGATLSIGAAGNYTLQGLLTNSGVVTVASGGQLNATVGGVTNTSSGSITNNGIIRDDLTNAGSVINSGIYIANIATNTGVITNNAAWTGNVASSTGAITNNSNWTGMIANAGTFTNTAGASVSGLLTNSAGTTINNGALSGGAVVSGGVLTGSGSVTNVTVSGGTIAPGTGVPGSSMTISGNLALQSGAMYMVTLNPATSSFAAVGGNASLNGSAAAFFLAGNYVSKKYTILTAAGGVTGAFSSLTSTNLPANVTSSLSYDATNAYLNLALNFLPPVAPNFGSGLTTNQQNLANALVGYFNTNGGIPLAFAGLTPAGLTIATGELGTGVIQSSIKANDLFLNLLLDPFVAGRGEGLGAGALIAAFADDETGSGHRSQSKRSPREQDAYAMATKVPYLSATAPNRWSIWSAAYGGSGSIDGDAIVGSQNVTARTYGIAAGADYMMSPHTLLGFAMAGGGTSYSLAQGLGRGSSDLFQAGAFARHNIGAAYLSGAFAYGWQDVTTNRTVLLAGTELLQGRFRAETYSGRIEAGYRFAMTVVDLTPYTAAQVISFDLPSYGEQTQGGSVPFALNYSGKTTTSTRSELGLRASRSFAVTDQVVTLRGRVAWAHDYNTDRTAFASFQALPGALFVVSGARPNADTALVSAGAETKWLNGFSLGATFEGEFSENTAFYAGKGVARYVW